MLILSPYGRFMKRMVEIHAAEAGDDCPTCRYPAPCDTMRTVWIFDLENDLDVTVER